MPLSSCHPNLGTQGRCERNLLETVPRKQHDSRPFSYIYATSVHEHRLHYTRLPQSAQSESSILCCCFAPVMSTGLDRELAQGSFLIPAPQVVAALGRGNAQQSVELRPRLLVLTLTEQGFDQDLPGVRAGRIEPEGRAAGVTCLRHFTAAQVNLGVSRVIVRLPGIESDQAAPVIRRSVEVSASHRDVCRGQQGQLAVPIAGQNGIKVLQRTDQIPLLPNQIATGFSRRHIVRGLPNGRIQERASGGGDG